MATTIASIVASIVALLVVVLLVVVLLAVALLVVMLLGWANLAFPALALLRESPWYSYCCHHL